MGFIVVNKDYVNKVKSETVQGVSTAAQIITGSVIGVIFGAMCVIWGIR